MNALSLCEFVEDTKCYKELSLYDSLLTPTGTKCVYLRLEENGALAQVIFEGIDGVWRVPIESIMYVGKPSIQYKSKSGMYDLHLDKKSISLHKQNK